MKHKYFLLPFKLSLRVTCWTTTIYIVHIKHLRQMLVHLQQVLKLLLNTLNMSKKTSSFVMCTFCQVVWQNADIKKLYFLPPCLHCSYKTLWYFLTLQKKYFCLFYTLAADIEMFEKCSLRSLSHPGGNSLERLSQITSVVILFWNTIISKTVL